MELEDLHTSLNRFKARLSAINEELIFLFKQSGINYVLLHVNYLLDRLTECEEILHSQILQLHDVLRVVTNGQITPSVVSPNEIKSVMNEIAQKIPIDLQLGFESDFDIWHIYKYSITTLILHGDEMYLIMKIPLTDRYISISLVRVYDILVPLPENASTNPKVGIFAQYDLRATYMAISGGYIKDLTKSEYDDYLCSWQILHNFNSYGCC